MPAAAFMPFRHRRAWQLEKSCGKAFTLGKQTPLSDMLHMLDFSAGELSGAIGPAWFSVAHAGKECVPFTPCLFPWHSHSLGPAVFSLDDLVIFLLVYSPVMALFTPTSLAVAQKSEKAIAFGAALRKNDAPCGPNLRMQRLYNCLSGMIGDVREMPEAALPGLLGIGVQIGEIA